MIDIEVLQELHKYSALYEERWGKEVDYIGLPSIVSQEKLLLALRHAVKTGDSFLVSMQKVRDITLEYLDYLEQHLELESGYIFDQPCPLCGNKVRFFVVGNSYEYVCDTKHCFRSCYRGL